MNIVQYMQEPIPAAYRECIDDVQRHVRETVSGMNYILYKTSPVAVETRPDPRYGADLMRLTLATEDPDMVWIDADVKIGPKGFFHPPEKGKPYFFSLNSHACDICVFYVNGATDYFKRMLDYYHRHSHRHYTGWPYGYINAIDRDIMPIPNGHFIHFDLYRARF